MKKMTDVSSQINTSVEGQSTSYQKILKMRDHLNEVTIPMIFLF